MKKIFILLFSLIFCVNIVFAANDLQKQFENQLKQARASLSFNVLYLINDDFKGYYNDGDTIIGMFENQYDELKKTNKEPDISYLSLIIKNYKQAYKIQNEAPLSYIFIEDDKYNLLEENTKKSIGIYNMLCNRAMQSSSDFDFDYYYNELKIAQNKFESDMNNMKQNNEIYLRIYSLYEQIKNYDKYMTDKKIIGKEFQRKLNELEHALYKLYSRIYDYSYSYEKKKYENWLVQNNKKIIKGTLQQFVYNQYNKPQVGALYIHDPKNLYLIVKQTVPGGIIVSGDTNLGSTYYKVNDIYIQTVKQFADDTYITEPIVAEYKGFYDYTTVLGAPRRIYKFYRYGQSEIKNNFKIPPEKYYFHGWDGKWGF